MIYIILNYVKIRIEMSNSLTALEAGPSVDIQFELWYVVLLRARFTEAVRYRYTDFIVQNI